MASPIRDFEWELWVKHLFPRCSILELGNKKNAIGVYKGWLTKKGYEHVSIDINGEDGALPLDLREPVKPRLLEMGLRTEYDVLTNSGVIEHVIPNQEAAWRNAYDLVKVGGVQIHVTPAAGYWMAHGLYHPTEEFFRQMAELNDMSIEHLDLYSWTKNKVLIRVVLLKSRDNQPFVYPGDHLLVKTPDAEELERRMK